ncbi:type II secretion system protein GspJ [Vibrio nigripulchritudo]|uniref:type II secretion system minor pseudopilin GspJ n=1 Tax=Vibrio nigripulchritudo TaxID=28173 RepID=UPI00190BF02E|nr:type II secretion system minor pseudopilin GspJ [Vibrio nigripulchritudo]BCL68204.1 type II secretion system protein GspJ [Vibrio nigripulchritudo]BDU29532.1 type II secretion system protein GspJ [Vibrio nigripulchritudo]
MHRRKVSGFTLIEVLVAIAVFASLSIAAYQVVNQVQLSNAQSLEKTERLQTMQRALIWMDNDFRQMALRQMRTNGEAPSQTLLSYGDYILESDDKGIVFSRLGWQNPQNVFPRGDVTKVGYRIREENLERVWWRYSDTPSGQEPLTRPILSDVESFTVTFYENGEWKEEWTKPKALPAAIAITLTLKDYGDIERVYLTPGGELTVTTPQEGNNQEGGSSQEGSNNG